MGMECLSSCWQGGLCGAHGLQQDCRTRHEASFVADVTVDEVLAEALDLLATETAEASAR